MALTMDSIRAFAKPKLPHQAGMNIRRPRLPLQQKEISLVGNGHHHLVLVPQECAREGRPGIQSQNFGQEIR